MEKHPLILEEPNNVEEDEKNETLDYIDASGVIFDSSSNKSFATLPLEAYFEPKRKRKSHSQPSLVHEANATIKWSKTVHPDDSKGNWKSTYDVKERRTSLIVLKESDEEHAIHHLSHGSRGEKVVYLKAKEPPITQLPPNVKEYLRSSRPSIINSHILSNLEDSCNNLKIYNTSTGIRKSKVFQKNKSNV
ncbi:hypothetical protein HMI54_003118 [Coelomomyces lativittatus]|nr:hypothetical protein HMI54_003118 [Coelomomyces lativittatus]KAJ1510154.1 hypothetical protein HMI56_006473 [Coelomomyces lativittatus]